LSPVINGRITQQNVDGKQLVSLTRVMDSLADSPKALQKWAVVDPSDTFAWNALALQRFESRLVRHILTNQSLTTPSKLHILQLSASCQEQYSFFLSASG